MSDRAAWVRENLPTCAGVAASFKAVFGEVRMVFASEGGNEIGQRGPDGIKLSETQVGPMFADRKTGRK